MRKLILWRLTIKSQDKKEKNLEKIFNKKWHNKIDI